MSEYHDRKAQEAWDALAGPFVTRTKAAYRECKTAADLLKLSKACWREHDAAWATVSRYGYDNMTRHGCAPYDRYSALGEQAKVYAIEFWRKAQRIQAGEALEKVMPHLAKVRG